jgi:predicted Zn-dependent peptidase
MDWLTAFIDDLDTVTTEQLAAAASEFFSPEKFTGVILGDADDLSASLSQLDGVRLP